MSRTGRLVSISIGVAAATVLVTYGYYWLTYPAARELAVIPKDVLQPDNNCGGVPGWQVTSTAGGGRVAYRGMRERDGRKRCLVTVDGQPGPEFDAVGFPFFSPDGRRIAYGAEDAGGAFVVVDGARGPSFGQVDDISLSFSPDGSRLAYPARDTRDGPWSLVTDHTRGRAFERVGRAVFSSDGGRVAHWASRRDETWTGGRQDIRFHQFVVVDGEPRSASPSATISRSTAALPIAQRARSALRRATSLRWPRSEIRESTAPAPPTLARASPASRPAPPRSPLGAEIGAAKEGAAFGEDDPGGSAGGRVPGRPVAPFRNSRSRIFIAWIALRVVGDCAPVQGAPQALARWFGPAAPEPRLTSPTGRGRSPAGRAGGRAPGSRG